jgi:hypothetical protein
MNKITLSGGAEDTLYGLFWFGPRETGEVASKGGEFELFKLGFCSRQNLTKSPKGKDTHLCVLTTAGYEYAFEKYVMEHN